MKKEIVKRAARPVEDRAAQAFQSAQRIQDYVTTIRVAWIGLAEELYGFIRSEMFKALGYATIEEWLAEPEIELSRRNVFYLTSVWEELHVKAKIPKKELGAHKITRLREVIPAIRRKQVTPETALADCEVLSRSELHEKYAQMTARDRDNHFDAEAEPAWERCPTCGQLYRAKS